MLSEQFLAILAQCELCFDFRLKVSLAFLLAKCVLGLDHGEVLNSWRVLEYLGQLAVLQHVLDGLGRVSGRSSLIGRASMVTFVTITHHKESVRRL